MPKLRASRPASLAIAILAIAFLCEAPPSNAATDFFDLANPQRLSLTLFASGYGSEKYGTTHGGFQLEQTLTRYLSIAASVSAYQVYQGTGFDSPLAPASRSATRNFGRFEGGLDFTPIEGTSLLVMGGHDVGDSHAPVIDSQFSSWLIPHSLHPLNVSFTAAHYYNNGVTSGTLDFRGVLLSTGSFILLGGAGSAIWGGGSAANAKAQAGPDLGIFVRDLHLRINFQGGYGSSRTYGLVSFSRTFAWDE